MAKEITQQALILHRRDYRETSLLVTFLTPEYGKFNAIVKGVRTKSKISQIKQAWLQPFQLLNISWIEKPTTNLPGLVKLRQLEPTKVRFPLDGENNICGLYVNELLYRLLYPHVEQEILFQSYQQTLYDLATTNNRIDQAWVLRQFECQLLMSMGVGLQTTVDAQQQPIQTHKIYHYYPELGATDIDYFQSKDSLYTARYTKISGECLLKFSRLEKCETCLNDWKKIFRMLIVHYLGNKPIQTRALFQS